MRRRSECWFVTRTNSVRSSSTFGSRLSTPITASTSSRASSVCARRPPQYVERPVMRIRFEVIATRSPSSEPHRLALADHLPDVLLDPRAHFLGNRLDEGLVAVRVGIVEVDGLEEADLELGGQVAEHAEQPQVRERGRDR